MQLFHERLSGWTSVSDTFVSFFGNLPNCFWLDRQHHPDERFTVIGSGQPANQLIPLNYENDPELTARRPDGSLYDHQPLRVVLGESELPTDKRIFNDAAPTVHFKTRSIHGVLAELFERGVRHIWVEGGPKVASNFVKLGLVDEYLTYLAPMLLGGDRTSIRNIDVNNITEARHLVFNEVTPLGNDLLIRANPVETRANSGFHADQRSI